MNELFVNIKVDREERPDIDAIYMEAVQAMTGHGGWPMTVFLTPKGKPFYGGTYFPPTPRQGMPGFRQVMLAIAEAWRERRRELESAGERLADALNRSAALQAAETPLNQQVLDRAVQGLLRSYDRFNGGFGDAPKFPQPMNLDFLLVAYGRTHDPATLQAVTHTLNKMAWGGIYDQLGGGFHRYSTDDLWLVPHFEKMLYDNALLARTYLHAWQVTGNPLPAHRGGDARLRDARDDRSGRRVLQCAGCGQRGGGRQVLPLAARGGHRAAGRRGRAAVQRVLRRHCARELPRGRAGRQHPAHPARCGCRGCGPGRVGRAADGRRRAGAQRPLRGAHAAHRTGRDDKGAGRWNGLMLRVRGRRRALDRPDYTATARRAAVPATQMIQEAGSWKLEAESKGIASFQLPCAAKLRPSSLPHLQGRPTHLNAYLEDYAAVAWGWCALYQVTFEQGVAGGRSALAQTLAANFRDPAGGFFQTSDDHETLSRGARTSSTTRSPRATAWLRNYSCA